MVKSPVFFFFLVVCSLAHSFSISEVNPTNIQKHWEVFRGNTCNVTAADLTKRRMYIMEQMKSYGLDVEVSGTEEGFQNIVASTRNINATPNNQKYFAIMSHYLPRCDATNDGVVDNGSGVAGVLELARILSTQSSSPQNFLFLLFEDVCGSLFPNASRAYMENGLEGKQIVAGFDLDEISIYDETPNTSGWSAPLSVFFPSLGLKEIKNSHRATWIGGFGPKELNEMSAKFGDVVSKYVPALTYYDMTTYLPADLQCNSKSPMKNFCLSDSGSFWVNKFGSAIPILELTDTSPMRVSTKPPNVDFSTNILKAVLAYIAAM